ncbi:MAG TPA: hypothetical protein VGV89_10640 [Thermoplasmata archaeon]|nr:hypothetical protein [Thermoplasmata archaeon]
MESSEQAQLREHVRQLRLAARGIGRDLRLEFDTMDEKIARLGKLTRKEAKYALLDLQDDFSAMGRTIDTEVRKVPGAVRSGAVAAGTAIRNGAVSAASATREALTDAGHSTKEASKNAMARMAGVNRKPMKEWRTQQ